MAGLSNGAVIAIVIAACLAATTIGAALFRHYNPAVSSAGQRFSREQEMYMRSVRLKNMGYNVRESRQGGMGGMMGHGNMQSPMGRERDVERGAESESEFSRY
ncbi:hypothetical protein BJY04DRAFT_212816 [Aspergillus karnatakaensis]|uniref:uncharacterized protein n=1 Tax=Aspergillus karnatakaensis TaxID=1810916 RepID=UPI003CCD8F54